MNKLETKYADGKEEVDFGNCFRCCNSLDCILCMFLYGVRSWLTILCPLSIDEQGYDNG